MGASTLVKAITIAASYMTLSGIYHLNEKKATLEDINIDNPTASVLNVGSGQYGAEQFTAIGDIKCDIDPVRDVEFCDIRKLPYDDNQFDYVVASHILEHLEPKDVSQAVNELNRVGRKVKIMVPHTGAIVRYLHPNHKSLVSIKSDGIEARSNPWRKMVLPTIAVSSLYALAR